jgi:Dolichyl-phosphate-mannose-protein mannosyltransferase
VTERRGGRGAGARAGGRRGAGETGAARARLGERGSGVERPLDAIERFARGRGAIALLIAVAVCANAVAFDTRLNTNGDNAQYLILAESILAGKGLAHVNTPNAEPHTKYPFLYPLALAGVLAVLPGALVAAKLVSTLAGIGSVLLVFLLWRARGSPVVALGAALATAVSPHILEFSHITLAEVPYLFLSLATLFAIERALAAKEDRWPQLALVLLGIMASYYTKSVGLALAVAAPVAFALRRRFRAALILLIGFGALSFPWYLRNKEVGQENLYLDYFLMRDPYRENSGTITPPEFAKRIGVNVVKYERFFLPNGFVPQAFTGMPGAPAVEGLVFFVPLALAAVGIASAMRRGYVATELYVIVFLVMIHMWPDVWSGTRFFLPLLPLLFAYALAGAERIAARVALRGATGGARAHADTSAKSPADALPHASPPAARAAALLAAALLIAVSAIATVQERAGRRGYTPDWANFFAAAEWIRANTPPEAIVSSRSSYILYWKTHRKTVGYRFTEEPEAVWQDLMQSGARYVLVDTFFWTGTTGRYLVPALEAHRDRWRPVWESTQQPPTFVLELLREGEAAG